MILPNGFVIEQGEPKRGGNGIVYICVKEGRRYALKLFNKNFEQYHHEVYIYKTLKRHNNVVQLIDYFELSEQKALVLEFCQKDLKTHIRNLEVSLQDKLILFAQIISAFETIQNDLKRIQFQFQHRDIKPENLMIGEGNQIKLIDFGESRIIALDNENDIYEFVPSTQLCGTPGYMDPMMEYMNGGFSEKSDLWSLGATFYYLLTNKTLKFDRAKMNNELRSLKNLTSDQRKQWKIKFIQKQTDLQLKENIENEKCLNLLNLILQVDINKRWCWEDLFKNKFVRSLIKSIPHLECLGFERKQIIRLRQEIQKKIVSTTFQQKAGQKFSEIYKIILKNGLLYLQTAIKMHEQFLELKELYPDFLQHWQDFEKCNYLLHLRSLIYFYSYNQIFTQIKSFHGQESISQNFIIELAQQQPILERIQLQIYYLQDCIRKNLTGNGLEARFINLQKEQCNNDEQREYSSTLQISQDEKKYFSFKQFDQDNNLNNPNFFDSDEFYQLLEAYLLKCIKVFLQNYEFISQNEAIILNQVIFICHHEKHRVVGQHEYIDKIHAYDQNCTKLGILQQAYEICFDLFELLEVKTVCNTFFYFEILHSHQWDSMILKKLKCFLENVFPGKLCLIYESHEDENIRLNIKCQDMKSLLWYQNDGNIIDINFSFIEKKVEEIIRILNFQ